MSSMKTVGEKISDLPDATDTPIDNDSSSSLLSPSAFGVSGTLPAVEPQFKLPLNRQKSTQQFVEEIDFNEIQTEEVVGKGSFGVVYKAKWRGRDVAVKHINTEGERRAFAIEILQLSRVSHPNIVRLYGACTSDPVCLVMEYAEGGSLYNVLHCEPRPHYNAGHAISWALQCAKGVAYLHNMKPKPLVHRDLKPPNLLLILGGRTLKICDFGTACDLNTYMTNNKGSAAWMAPEVFEGSKYTEKCDIFSWGVILWEVLSRRKPFDDIGGSAYRIMWAVHVGQRPPLIEGCPKPIESLITRCWLKNPDERPAMEEIVEIMSSLAGFFSGELEPIEYDPNKYGERTNEDDTIDVTHDTSKQIINDSSNYYDAEINECRTLDSFNNDLFREEKKYNPLIYHPSQFLRDRENEKKGSSSATSMISNVYGKSLSTVSSHNFQPLRIDCDPAAWTVTASIEETNPVQSISHPDSIYPEPIELESQSRINTSDWNDFEEMYRVLDGDLRPLTPDNTDTQSMEIFQLHKLIAKDYLKVQTDVALAGQRKREALQKMSKMEATDKLEIQKLTDEKESLVKLYRNLKRQLEIMQRPERVIPTTNSAVSIPGEDGWVVVPCQEPSKI